MEQQIETARQQGYSDQEIMDFLKTSQPDNLQNATSYIVNNPMNPAIQNARSQLGNQKYDDWCQAFVEQMSGKGFQGQSAIDAWNRNQDKQQTDFSNLKSGDAIYFNADNSNGGNGHTGIYTGNGNFISATDNGVQEMPINDWIAKTGQNPLGYLPQ